jgi:2-dehydro-3-deoxygluconokinase
MVELTQSSSKTLKQSFAGDVFNTAVYLKRIFNQHKVHFISAIGLDAFSNDMLNSCHQESLNTELVFRMPEKNLGLYSIQTDNDGERRFSYWRNDSAARQLMQFVNNEVITQLKHADMVFFSGISLAVITPAYRKKFWIFIERLKAAGVTIVFDPNYRAAMWENERQAKDQYEHAFYLADIILPGVDDFTDLYGLTSAEQILEFCQFFAIQELIIKNGQHGILCWHQGNCDYFNIVAVDKVIDSTAAGDSFNGAYLGARLQGSSVAEAVKLASKVAAIVIQYPGAIVPFNIFTEHLSGLSKKESIGVSDSTS